MPIAFNLNVNTMTQVPDILHGFMAETIRLNDDYSGTVIATLVSKKAARVTNKAILYIHGYSDYFFHEELAEFYVTHGFNFYAIDLRKYGRSLLPGQRFNFCKDMTEYYEELDAAMHLITIRDGNTTVVLNGHSTGGLLATIYVQDRQTKLPLSIKGVILNSPFYDFNDSLLLEFVAEWLVYYLGAIVPYLVVPSSGLPFYGESLSVKYNRGGTAMFNEEWKPVLTSPPICAGWVRAVKMAQRRVQGGSISLIVPTLLLHSDKSGGGKIWNDSYTNSDCVLDVNDIFFYGQNIITRTKPEILTEKAIPNGLHDLALSSNGKARSDFYATVEDWLFRNFVA